MLELARYVVLNPVRAGMVAEAGQWPWISYATTIAPPQHPRPDWLAVDAILRLFVDGQTLPERQRALALYIDHVRAGVGLPSVWESLSSQMFLGDEQFVQKMMNRLTQAQNNKPTAQWQEVPAQERKAVKIALAACRT